VIYHASGYRVFVDDRCELFGDDWLAKLVAAGADPGPAMAGWQAEHGSFDFALTRTRSAFDGWFRARPGEWEPIKTTPTGSFYRRVARPPASGG
jgi:hypothetical protein